MNFQAKLTSPLEKIFYDDKLRSFKSYPKSSALNGEKHDFCVAYLNADYSGETYCNSACCVKIESPLSEKIRLFTIEHVPAVFAGPISNPPEKGYLRTEPGLYPDLLMPIAHDGSAHLQLPPHILNSLLVEIDTTDVPAGSYDIAVIFSAVDGTELCRLSHRLRVIGAALPEQDVLVTHWLHTDCIADYYGLKVFSESYWKTVENFIKVYAEGGNTLIYTPLFTPPLDTAVGGERTTVQLVDVKRTGAKDGYTYTFGFEKLHRWVGLCEKHGIRHFEMSHLFTQWGAYHCPKIIAETENGKTEKIFGWDTDAHGESYDAFLRAFLPALLKELSALGLEKRTYFHISDEPQKNHVDSYRACSDIIRKYLTGYPIMDAMMDTDFYDRGLVDIPIPHVRNCKSFFEKDVKPRYVYYCGADKNFMGRALGMPSARNRISGAQFYANRVEGFLHWGFNFYNAAGSVRRIDPYFVTDADKHFCAGDSYLVYPAPDKTAYLSLRYTNFRDGMQDLRALKLCEALCGREAVSRVMCALNGGKPLDILETPEDLDYTLKLREEINRMIAGAREK